MKVKFAMNAETLSAIVVKDIYKEPNFHSPMEMAAETFKNQSDKDILLDWIWATHLASCPYTLTLQTTAFSLFSGNRKMEEHAFWKL